jgi:hypothetical protein
MCQMPSAKKVSHAYESVIRGNDVVQKISIEVRELEFTTTIEFTTSTHIFRRGEIIESK